MQEDITVEKADEIIEKYIKFILDNQESMTVFPWSSFPFYEKHIIKAFNVTKQRLVREGRFDQKAQDSLDYFFGCLNSFKDDEIAIKINSIMKRIKNKEEVSEDEKEFVRKNV